ncbi:MAG: hypothetical protein PHO80_04055, partial [Candidatus Gracilibacteria bacterium]|nr:hypothetical protein [Candidatus Gracilibacteria bacterium]MDD4530695.1 hypothetical protein [Candidatus Gracilibacteria bacterium]
KILLISGVAGFTKGVVKYGIKKLGKDGVEYTIQKEARELTEEEIIALNKAEAKQLQKQGLMKENVGGGMGEEMKFFKDSDTILGDFAQFLKTNKRYGKASIYTDKETGNFLYRDTLHNNHLEIFNKKGVHLGEGDPLTGEIISGTADSSKTIKNIIK